MHNINLKNIGVKPLLSDKSISVEKITLEEDRKIPHPACDVVATSHFGLI